LKFDIGNEDSPKGHALVYFKDSLGSKIYASYVILLPITVDVSKYVPPFLMNQVGDFSADDMSAFAFPPAPEEVEDYDFLVQLAELRSDDLIDAGTFDGSDITSSMMKVNDLTQEYLDLYSDHLDTPQEHVVSLNPSSEVNDLMYSLMSENDRLTELTKLIGQMRYAIDSGEDKIIDETERDLFVLAAYFTETFQLSKLLSVAKKSGDLSATLTDLYLKRCFHLSREEYQQLGEVEDQISKLT
tara:strand:- start:1620 stop:2348 length:729 start_codon:yes stop_codon:yes gene_type:complete